MQKWKWPLFLMNLIIYKQRIIRGDDIRLSKRLQTHELNQKEWCPLQLSKLLRHACDDVFSFSISKPNVFGQRIIYLKCAKCLQLILLIFFDISLSNIKVKLNHICIHMKVKEIVTQTKYRFFLFFEKFHYSKVFKKVGKLICFHNKNNPELQNLFFENSYSIFYKKFIQKIFNTGHTFEEFFHILGKYGDVQLFVSETNPFNNFEFSSKSKFNNLFIHTICFVAPWAKCILRWSKVLELDSSFKATFPFCYHIPVVIKHNISVPIGFIIHPKEDMMIYQKMLEALRMSCGENECKDFVILSDGHKAIESFSQFNNFKQFLCYRHFIETFGSNSFLGRIVAHLLYCYSEDSFQQELSYAISEIQEYLSRDVIDDVHLHRFALYTGYEIRKNSIKPCFPQLLQKLGFWLRKEIPTCTNHVESYHGKINQQLKGNFNFISGIHTLLEYIHHKFQKIDKDSHRVMSLDLKRIERLSESYDSTLNECDCIHSNILESKYGISFPCQHTYQFWKKHNMLPPKILLPNLDLKYDYSLNVEIIIPENQVTPKKIKKEHIGIQVIESDDYDKYSRSGKNFMKAVHSVASKYHIELNESDYFCSTILLKVMSLSLKDLSHPVTNARFYVMCWNDEERLKLVLKTFYQK